MALAGCSTPAPPQPAQPALPANWQGDTGDATAPAPDLRSWWTHFNDPVLNQLVEQALAQNLGLAQARSRLRQARLLLGRDEATYLPSLALSARTAQDAAAVDSYFHAGLDVSWEIGLFGARAAIGQVGQARLDSAAAALQAVRVTVVAEVARRYLDLCSARQEEAVLLLMVQRDDDAVRLQRTRQQLRLAGTDEASALAVRAAQTQAQLATPRAAAAQAAQALALLLGTSAWTPPPSHPPQASSTAPAPDTASAPDKALPPNTSPPLRVPLAMPQLASLHIDQLPADLLRWRPDIRAAEAELLRVTGELGLAQAELRPRLVLGLSYLYAYNLTQNRRTVNSTVWALGPLLDVPLLDWGRRAAAAQAQKEALHGATLAWQQTLLDAIGETESALAALAQAGQRVQALLQAQQLLEAGADRAATRQRLGLGSGGQALEAARAALQAALDVHAAQALRGQAFVLLYKSLGGAPLESDGQGGS